GAGRRLRVRDEPRGGPGSRWRPRRAVGQQAGRRACHLGPRSRPLAVNALTRAFRYSRGVENPQEELAAAVAELRAYLSWAGEGGPVMVSLPPPSTLTSHSPSPSHSMPKLPTIPLDQVRAELGECVRCKLHKGRHTIVFGV